MATRGSRATATGLALTMIAVSVGVASSNGFAFLLLVSFVGVLGGSSLIFVGVRMVPDDPTPPMGRPGLLASGLELLVASVRALVPCLRRNLALVGLFLASSAATVTADSETAPVVLCFSAFALLLFGLSLLSIGVLLGEQEQ